MRKMMLCIILLILTFSLTFAEADTVWAMCQPDSYVNIRSKPNSRSRIEGYALCGYDLETDGKTKNGFLHVYTTIEAGEGWIANGYVVWDEPKEMNKWHSIRSPYRVAIRRTIGGKVRTWGHDCDSVKVYWASNEWAVTNRGFVKTEFLEVDADHGK